MGGAGDFCAGKYRMATQRSPSRKVNVPIELRVNARQYVRDTNNEVAEYGSYPSFFISDASVANANAGLNPHDYANAGISMQFTIVSQALKDALGAQAVAEKAIETLAALSRSLEERLDAAEKKNETVTALARSLEVRLAATEKESQIITDLSRATRALELRVQELEGDPSEVSAVASLLSALNKRPARTSRSGASSPGLGLGFEHVEAPDTL